MQRDFTIQQGADLVLPFYWYDGVPIVKPISAVTLAYPPVLTATGHGLPADRIPVSISGVKGATQLNTEDDDRVYALKIDTDTFSLPDIDASGFRPYTSGGYVVYRAPKDLTDYTARMQLRSSIPSDTVILELTDANDDITLGGATGKVTLVLTAAQTAALTFRRAVYQLELVSAAGVVTRLAGGTITLDKEVTR